MIFIDLFFKATGNSYTLQFLKDEPVHFYEYNSYIFDLAWSLTLIIFLTICYIFELVFREGERLREENELTV